MKNALTEDEGLSRSDWNTTLGELCDRFGGGIQTGPFGSQLHASDYSEDGTPVVMPQDLVNGRIVCDRIARVPERIVRDLSRHALRFGDVVFSRRGDVTRFAVVTHEQKGWLCGTGCIRIRLNCPEVNIPFFQHYLQQRSIGEWLIHQAKGVTMPNLNTDIVRALPFVYPPLAEQRRIAAILDKADALRQKRRVALQRVDSLAHSIFLDMFGDALQESDPRVFELGGFCTRITDGTHQPPKWAANGIPFLFVSNVRGRRIDFNTEKFISKDTYLELTRNCPIEPGDVLYTTVGSYGNSAVVPKGQLFAFQRHIAHLKPDRSLVEPEYLAVLMESSFVRRQADRLARGIAQKTLNLAEIRSFKVMIPDLGEQREFLKRSRGIAVLKERMVASEQQFDSVFSSLQHRAFRGEL